MDFHWEKQKIDRISAWMLWKWLWLYYILKYPQKNVCDAFGNINQFDAHKIDLFGEEENERSKHTGALRTIQKKKRFETLNEFEALTGQT